MNVLGIETSCDETAASVVKNGRQVLSSQVSSSLEFHRKYGGVVPEIAARMQLETVAAVADEALSQAGIRSKDLSLVSVTSGPGLLGSLLIGISFAKSVSLSLGLPLLGVNHLYSHIYANFLNGAGVRLPFVALVVSGGHTSLFYVKDFHRMELLGETQDDACGEAFDKVAKILKLGYPGGPLIERLARAGDRKKIKFRCSSTQQPLNFSFSGIKTAVYYLARAQSLSLSEKKDIAASFQETVLETLVQKSLLACKQKQAERLVVGGGVAANGRLREKFLSAASAWGIKCYFPPVSLCTDNASMVAGLAYQLYKKGMRDNLGLTAVV